MLNPIKSLWILTSRAMCLSLFDTHTHIRSGIRDVWTVWTLHVKETGCEAPNDVWFGVTPWNGLDVWCWWAWCGKQVHFATFCTTQRGVWHTPGRSVAWLGWWVVAHVPQMLNEYCMCRGANALIDYLNMMEAQVLSSVKEFELIFKRYDTIVQNYCLNFMNNMIYIKFNWH